MARTPSVVLSPADKKLKVIDLKAQIKLIKADQKAANDTIKAQTKVVTATTKQLEKLQGQLTMLTTKAA